MGIDPGVRRTLIMIDEYRMGLGRCVSAYSACYLSLMIAPCYCHNRTWTMACLVAAEYLTIAGIAGMTTEHVPKCDAPKDRSLLQQRQSRPTEHLLQEHA